MSFSVAGILANNNNPQVKREQYLKIRTHGNANNPKFRFAF